MGEEMSDNCNCGIPWISGENCERCNKPISPERLKSVKSGPSQSKTGDAILLVIFLIVARPSGAYFFLGLLVIGLIWCISYLQTSFIRGLASYFQMRSIDYLERRRAN